MLAKIIKIGGSKGIRIPKAVLEQCHFKDEVILKVDKNKLIIQPSKTKVREGWRESFQADKTPLTASEKFDYIPTKFDEEDWEW
jgi:antitoxin MazE